MSKTFVNKKLINPKYIYIHNGVAYANAPKLCKSLGLSYNHMKNEMYQNDNVYVKIINITKEKIGRSFIYKNGKVKINDIDDFCQQFGLDKKEAIQQIKETGSFKNDIKIRRTQAYAIKISYEFNGKNYPAGDVLPIIK